MAKITATLTPAAAHKYMVSRALFPKPCIRGGRFRSPLKDAKEREGIRRIPFIPKWRGAPTEAADFGETHRVLYSGELFAAACVQARCKLDQGLYLFFVLGLNGPA